MAVLPFGLWDVGDSFNQAVDLEEEEQDQYECEDVSTRTVFEFIAKDQAGLSGETLILACGDAANVFVKTYFDLPDATIGEIKTEKHEENISKRQKDKHACQFYQISSAIFCLCRMYIKPEDSLAFIEKILSHIKVKRISVLCSSPKSSFQGNDEVRYSGMDVLRCLKSSTVTENSTNVPIMEDGNIIQNVPAAALSYCEHKKLPCVLYNNYTESHFVDGFSLKTYEDVLHEEIFKTIPKATEETVTKRLKSFEGIGVADNNLYI